MLVKAFKMTVVLIHIWTFQKVIKDEKVSHKVLLSANLVEAHSLFRDVLLISQIILIQLLENLLSNLLNLLL